MKTQAGDEHEIQGVDGDDTSIENVLLSVVLVPALAVGLFYLFKMILLPIFIYLVVGGGIC